MLSVFYLSVTIKSIMLNVVMIKAVMLNVIMLSVVMLNVVMLNVLSPFLLLFKRATKEASTVILQRLYFVVCCEHFHPSLILALLLNYGANFSIQHFLSQPPLIENAQTILPTKLKTFPHVNNHFIFIKV
jgi:hypothetical protein